MALDVSKKPKVGSEQKGDKMSKISLSKTSSTVNLAKGAGKIIVNLNWDQNAGKVVKKSFFGGTKVSGGIDLDLGCLFELKDGSKGAVQALGNAFGNFNQAPYVNLDKDDRTGSSTDGENLFINGSQIEKMKRILVYTFIYEGIPSWDQANGVITIKNAGPDIIISLDEHDKSKTMCALAMISNDNGTFKIQRLVEYFSGHRLMDQAYNWGLNWVAGSK